MNDSASSKADSHDYVVVARRYRPQTFEELIGQEHVSHALTRAISSRRVGHAYLFTGARGVGKTSAARILAKALNCEQGPTPIPCNNCELCLSVSTGDDVDVLEIDGASNRGIDEIRQLRQNVAVRPSRARFKIYIIDEVHMLTKEAFNALLKTLEEPPEHVKFIFATTEPNKIPVTILSRCQRYDFAGIETESIQSRLRQIAEAEGVALEDDAGQILAMRAAGSMRDSQSLLEQLLATGAENITSDDVTTMLGIAPATRLSQLIHPLIERNAAVALDELSASVSEGAEVSQLVDQLLGYFRDVMTQAVGCDESRLLYALPSQKEEIRQIASSLGVQSLLAIVQILDQTSARMRISSHTRILAEMAIVRICNLEDLDELASLIKKLNESPSHLSSALKKNNTDRKPLASTPQQKKVLSPSTQQSIEPPTQFDAVTTNTIAVETKSPLLAENVEDVWKQVLDSLTGMLTEHAAEASEVTVDGNNRLVLGFCSDFHRECCERPNNKSRLESSLREICGDEVGLIIKAIEQVDNSKVTKQKPKSRRQLQADLAERPFIKRAMELFDGESSGIHFVQTKDKK